MLLLLAALSAQIDADILAQLEGLCAGVPMTRAGQECVDAVAVQDAWTWAQEGDSLIGRGVVPVPGDRLNDAVLAVRYLDALPEPSMPEHCLAAKRDLDAAKSAPVDVREAALRGICWAVPTFKGDAAAYRAAFQRMQGAWIRWRSAHGVQNLRWGMTPADVQRAKIRSVLGGTTRPVFARGRLVGVDVDLGASANLDRAWTAQNALGAKYAATGNDALDRDPEDLRSFAERGYRVAVGLDEVSIRYNDPGTEIELQAHQARPGRTGVRTVIRYRSTELEWLIEDAEAEQRAGVARDL